MRIFGLIGRSLTHSFSHKYFSQKFYDDNINDCKYINIEIGNIKEIRNIIKEYNLCGFNVTIPYKETVIPFLDKISNEAKEIGSVNTVKIINHKLYGYNTDIFGFEKSIYPLLENKRKALILGNGGASKSVQFVFNKLNIDFQLISRNSKLDYHNITKEILEFVDIIVNCTPLGTYPKINEYPTIPYSLLNSKHLLYDLVYNPKQTKFLTFGLEKNCIIKNGEEMLSLQAEKSWEIWNSPHIR
mgnify:CR=1 FL=1